jgi:hypothetical protein
MTMMAFWVMIVITHQNLFSLHPIEGISNTIRVLFGYRHLPHFHFNDTTIFLDLLLTELQR